MRNHKTAATLRSIVIVASAIATFSCSRTCTGPAGPVLAVTTSSPEATKSYLDALLKTIEAYAIHKATIDWASFRAQVSAAAGDPQTISDLAPAIGVALRLLDDHESFYLSPRDGLIGPSPEGCEAAAPISPRLPDTIGYVKVLNCPCEGPVEIAQFAESIQRAIRTADRPGLTGWIVDLRENGGGNMWPMIAGVGPVLGEGIIGHIVYNDREYEREYRAGAALSLNEAFARVESPYKLLAEYPRVAVLTSGNTNSAGEAIAVYFRGRPLTRSFGTPTCGHHHLLQDVPQRAGAVLWLVTARHEDRTRMKYGGPITPDETIADAQAAVNRAIAWLQGGG